MCHDVDLVKRCLDGDEDAVRALVEQFQQAVFGLCLRMLGQRQDAEDAAQESLLRMVRSLHRWDGKRPLKPWVMTIAANRCRTYMEKRSRLPLASEYAANTPEANDSRESRADLAEELQQALDQLRNDYRTVFVLFHYQEMTCAEIGEIVNCPEGTVKTWLHRARKQLAEYLQRRGIGPHASYELPPVRTTS